MPGNSIPAAARMNMLHSMHDNIFAMVTAEPVHASPLAASRTPLRMPRLLEAAAPPLSHGHGQSSNSYVRSFAEIMKSARASWLVVNDEATVMVLKNFFVFVTPPGHHKCYLVLLLSLVVAWQ